MYTFEFDAAAYRRIRLPWLLFLLFLSLIFDIVLFYLWKTGVSLNAQFYWNVGFGFLWIVNLLLLKAVSLQQYFHIKKLRTRSYVRLENGKVIHYVFRAQISHWQVEAIKETRFSSGGKNEYIAADTFHISYVNHLVRRSNGSIKINGVIESESLNEGWEEYSSDVGKVFKKTVRHHKIPGYYKGMDAIFDTLNRLKE